MGGGFVLSSKSFGGCEDWRELLAKAGIVSSNVARGARSVRMGF
jgi:hypothetical protein